MALTIIRTQAELTARHYEAAQRDEVEAFEYLRQVIDADDTDNEAEDYREIDHTAKNCLSWMLRHIGRCRWRHARQVTQQFVAWKWMLGHPDADTFYGAHNKPEGNDPRHTYIYLRDQIQSGEWDRLTRQAAARHKAESKQDDMADTLHGAESQPGARPFVNTPTLTTQPQVMEAR